MGERETSEVYLVVSPSSDRAKAIFWEESPGRGIPPSDAFSRHSSQKMQRKHRCSLRIQILVERSAMQSTGSGDWGAAGYFPDVVMSPSSDRAEAKIF